MPLAPGTRLGPYEILAPLGAGGMGEVYRAKDTRLGREVAVKVLPGHLATTPELRARFEREAKTISSLNHPHICTLFDIGKEGETDYLVMELVEGETLAHRLEKGPLPLADVLRLGGQVADALERAHRAGVVHRDLKPGNVMLTKGGVKLLDFGLARVTGLTGPVAGATMMHESPTLPAPLTAEGTIVGTFQYMAPEQLEGKEADVRSDLWALGCVLYEMATARRAFAGASQASLIASILKEEPRPLGELAPMSPPELDRLVRACLRKDPDDRMQTAHDVRMQLGWLSDGASGLGSSGLSRAGALGTGAVRRRRLPGAAWLGLGTAVGALVALGAGFLIRGGGAGPEGVTQFEIFAPPGGTLSSYSSDAAISPDGRTLAIVVSDSGGTSGIWVRPLGSLKGRVLPGTENGSAPFWSPDSRTIAFFADRKLKKLAVDGGPTAVLADAPDARGGTWLKGGMIVFAPTASGALFKVSGEGGDAVEVARPDSTAHESALRFPVALPDGKHFAFVSLPRVDGLFRVSVGSVDGGQPRFLVKSGHGVVCAGDYLLYALNDQMVAHKLDSALRLSGKPIVLGEAPFSTGLEGSPIAAASGNGVIVHTLAGLRNTRVVIRDEPGGVEHTVNVPPARYESGSMSPDGKRLLLIKRVSPSLYEMWMVDLDRGLASRFLQKTNAAVLGFPMWSSDGSRVAYSSSVSGTPQLYVKRTDGSGDEEMVYQSNAIFKNPGSWTADGKQILFEQPNSTTGWDIWIVDADGNHAARPLLNSTSNENGGWVSPDGKWFVYYSDETGRNEVYAQTFPAPGRRYQVTTSGGMFAQWKSDGKVIRVLNLQDGAVREIPVSTSPTFTVGSPRLMHKVQSHEIFYFPSADQQRTLVIEEEAGASAPSFVVETHWTAALRAKP